MFYRFFPDNQYSLSSLANSYLWFSETKDFNDPFETCINDTLIYEDLDNVKDSIFIDELKAQKHEFLNVIEKETHLLELAITNHKRYRDLKKEVLGYVKEKHLETFRKYSILKWCCFSVEDEKNGSPIQSKLMWGHYSNGLRGFLIEFNKYTLIESLNKSVKVIAPQNYVINAPINYCELSPIPFYSEFISKVKRTEKLADFLTQKSSEWSYESENRLGSQEQKINYAKDTIKRIIIGEKMSQDYREMLLIIIKSALPNVEIVEAYIDTSDFQIKTKHLYTCPA